MHPIDAVHVDLELIPRLHPTPPAEHIALLTEIQAHVRQVRDLIPCQYRIIPQFDVLTHPVPLIIFQSFIEHPFPHHHVRM